MLSKIRKQKLEKNIWKFYLYRVFTSLMFIGPIFVLFFQDNGLSMTQIMILESAYTIGIMLTIIPFGIIADYVGRKKILVVNSIFYLLGWILYSLGYSFTQFLIANLIFSLSTAMWMASGTPFFYDNLRELGREGNFKRLFGKVIGINNIAEGTAVLLGGYIATYSLRLPFWFSVFPAAVALIITFGFTETKRYKHKEKNYLTHLKDAASFTVKHPKVRFFIIYAAIVWGLMFIAYMFYQPYFVSLKIPLVAFGILYAAMHGVAALGGKYAHVIEEKLGEKKVLLLVLVILILSFLGLSKFVLIMGILIPLIISFTGGVFDPIITDYFHKHVESHHRSTVNSLNMLVTSAFASAIAPFFGWIFDVYSLQAAFIVAGAIAAVNIFILSLMYYIGWKRLKDGKKEVF